MKAITTLGCLLIGWNMDILKECGEASHRQFKKTTLCHLYHDGTLGYNWLLLC